MNDPIKEKAANHGLPGDDFTTSTNVDTGDQLRTFRNQERIIWLPDTVWEDLDWTEDDPQDFMDKILEKKHFDENDRPPPFHGDILAGRDKNEKIIMFRLLIPNSTRFGQKEVDW
jgi:hypothetical protein